MPVSTDSDHGPVFEPALLQSGLRAFAAGQLRGLRLRPRPLSGPSPAQGAPAGRGLRRLRGRRLRANLGNRLALARRRRTGVSGERQRRNCRQRSAVPTEARRHRVHPSLAATSDRQSPRRRGTTALSESRRGSPPPASSLAMAVVDHSYAQESARAHRHPARTTNSSSGMPPPTWATVSDGSV